MALLYAERLYDLDKEYLLYKLSVMAIEDIGLGNIETVHDFMKTRINKDNIEDLGGKDYLLKKVSEFTLSIKDRSACELPMLANFSIDLHGKPKEYVEQLYLDEDIDISIRLMAGWEILGSDKLKNSFILNKEDNIERFINLNKDLIKDNKVIDIIRDGYNIHKEPHFIAMGLLKSIYEIEKNMSLGNYKTGSVVEKTFKKHFVGKGWLLDGVDWHTKEGKTAIYNFSKENNILTKELKSLGVYQDNIPHIIGLLFRSIGHQVNKRLVYPTAVKILKEVEKVSIQSVLNNKNINSKLLFEIFIKTYPLLRNKIESSLTIPDPQSFPF